MGFDCSCSSCCGPGCDCGCAGDCCLHQRSQPAASAEPARRASGWRHIRWPRGLPGWRPCRSMFRTPQSAVAAWTASISSASSASPAMWNRPCRVPSAVGLRRCHLAQIAWASGEGIGIHAVAGIAGVPNRGRQPHRWHAAEWRRAPMAAAMTAVTISVAVAKFSIPDERQERRRWIPGNLQLAAREPSATQLASCSSTRRQHSHPNRCS